MTGVQTCALPISTEEKTEGEKQEEKVEEKIIEKPEEKKEVVKEEIDKKKVKKEEAIVKGLDLRASTKKTSALCRFIKGKKIDRALEDVTRIVNKKIAVPIKGEYPHKKGMAGGIYPVKVAKLFIKLLKSLKANALVNSLDEEKTIIYTAKADIASRPSRKGNRKFKRTNVLLIAKERENKKEKKK